MASRESPNSPAGPAPLSASQAPAKARIGEIVPSLYSVTYIGLWYRGDALSMEQVVERAKTFGYGGVEIEAKRPHGSPWTGPRNAAGISLNGRAIRGSGSPASPP